MNRGLLEKAFREIWPLTVGFMALLAIAKGFLSYVLPTYKKELLEVILNMGFFRTLLSALLGTPITQEMGAQLMQAIPWVHPLVLIILFAHETTVCTRLPAGEIDRGTIDVLLGLPVSRWEAYVAHSLVWALSGLALVLAGLLANRIGTSFAGTSMAPASTIAMTLVNGYCLYLATGAIACFISSLSRSRGAAVGAVLAVVIISFLINFLAEFWEPARGLRFLSLLSYYEPLRIFQEGSWPIGNIIVLVVSGGVLWTAGGVVFQRRDIAVR